MYVRNIAMKLTMQKQKEQLSDVVGSLDVERREGKQQTIKIEP